MDACKCNIDYPNYVWNCRYCRYRDSCECAKGKGKKIFSLLQWIFIFPIKLSDLILKKKDLDLITKIFIIAAGWGIFLFAIYTTIDYNLTLADSHEPHNILTIAGTGDDELVNLGFECEGAYVYQGETKKGHYIYRRNGAFGDQFTPDGMMAESENNDIATIELMPEREIKYGEYYKYYYKITGKSVGRTIMYIKSDDGRIIYESIYVTVRASKKGEKGVLSMDISHSDVFKH